jgi:hypothetical protein
MNDQAIILPFHTPVKRMLTAKQKDIVSLVSKIIVQKTLKDANEKRIPLPALQQRRAEQ